MHAVPRRRLCERALSHVKICSSAIAETPPYALPEHMSWRVKAKADAKRAARASLNDRLGNSLSAGKSGRRRLALRRGLALVLLVLAIGLAAMLAAAR